MAITHTARASAIIKAPLTKVWQALTDPLIVKQYFFGVDLITDWKEGSPITYRGEWQGKKFEDKGVVMKIIPEKMIKTSYWSSFSGLEDIPENYQYVEYLLEQEPHGVKLSITQEGIKSDEGARHSERNWNGVLGALQKLFDDGAALISR